MDKGIKKVIVFLIGLIAAIGLLLYLNFDHFIDYEKYGLRGFTAENFSNPITADGTVELELLSETKGHSLAIILVPAEVSGGEEVKVEIFDASHKLLMTYFISENEYSTGRYTITPLDFTSEKGAKYYVTLSSTETEVEKATRLAIGSAPATDVLSWTHNGYAESSVPSMCFIYKDLKLLSVLIVALSAMVILFVAITLLLKNKNKFLDILINIALIGIIVYLVAASIYVIELLQTAALLDLPIKVILANMLIVAGLAGIFFMFTGKVNTAFSSAVIAAVFLGISNHYLMLFRGTVLLPSDITGLTTAAKVAGNYTFTMDDNMVCAIAVMLSAVAVMFYPIAEFLQRTGKKMIIRLLSLVMAVAMLVVPATNPAMFDAEVQLWRQIVGSRERNGFLLNFAANIPLLIRQKPEGYDANNLEGYVDVEKAVYNSKNAQLTQEQLPNILIVMNESFTDPRTVLEVKDAEKLLPVFDKLKEDENAFVGQVAVSIFGGGTSCSEYEMLTGFSIRTDNANTAPYFTYFKEKTPSLVWYLGNMGYTTTSYHPATMKNWYRNTAYPNHGFERMIFLNESNQTLNDSTGALTGQKLEFKNVFSNFPADITGYEVVMNLMKESEEPFFNFHITMQNHGEYLDKNANFNVAKDNWSSYLNLLNHSDQQLGEFLDMLSDFDEPTVVIFFGDHWSYYDENKLEAAGISVDSMTEEQLTDYYSTPYIVWSNCGYDFSGLPQQTSLSYLSALVMNQLGFELTPWQNFLVYLSDKIPVYTVYNVQSNLTQAEYDDIMYRLECLHYNGLNDSKNINTHIFGNME